ncbi:MAG: 2-C-methyl-D-erythritol 2,4-cyclodiphosphate synthase [Gammaproteobacteria bacterium]|nr:2-C-methyl-D-erythritol 2,4-cyclodiphosphate synthase [Gammaproteobacteria bacterium]
MRVGHGFDVHRLEEGIPLVLGGVHVPYPRGLSAHSDGDVVIHALCDALLGAAALGDIGQHFPDTSEEYEGIDSRVLLRTVNTRLRENGYRLHNADVTIVAQAPRLASYIAQMRENLASDLGMAPSSISVKATTSEGMGYTGRGEGIAAHAVALLDEPS